VASRRGVAWKGGQEVTMGNGNGGVQVLLSDVIDIKTSVRTGDFVVKLSEGFVDPAKQIDEYVVTSQLQQAFDHALSLVRDSLERNVSQAAYLHGSFGSGKSHFMTVLSAILDDNPAARGKKQLQGVIAKHDSMIGSARFLLVPYHLIGAVSLDAAILGGYAKLIAEKHADARPPAVYRDDALLADARKNRQDLGDEAFIARLSGGGVVASAEDSWRSWNETTWTPATLDAAFAAHQGDPARTRLVEDLLKNVFTSYAAGMRGAAGAYLPLETGLSVMSEHAKNLGYDGVILFLDELILWLASRLSDQAFVQTEANKLVKLFESGDAHRPIPIVSFVARQRDLSDLIGKDTVGTQVQALEDTIDYLKGRMETVSLEDRNLPQIAQERILKPKDDAAKAILDEAFKRLPSDRPEMWDPLIDEHGATQSDAKAFRDLYPFSPAFLNTLVSLSGALQRERTGLKVLAELLTQRRDDLVVGQLIPLGDLWDVLATNEVQAFSPQLRHEFDAARKFHLTRVRPFLLNKYGVTEDDIAGLPHTHPFRRADRLVKTLLLAYLAPDASALKQLTASKLAALNYGVIRALVKGEEASEVAAILKSIASEFGELRYDTSENPVYRLHLTGVDVDAILRAVEGKADSDSERRRFVKEMLLSELGVKDGGSLVQGKDFVWRGTKRRVGIVVGNVRDTGDLSDDVFELAPDEDLRVVVDYPFDETGHTPIEDIHRIGKLRERGKDGAVICWLPSFLSNAVRTDLKRLLGMRYLLGSQDRINANAPMLSSEQREQAKNQMDHQYGVLSQKLKTIIRAAYGLARPDEESLDARPEGGHLHALDEGFRETPTAGVTFERALGNLCDQMLVHLYPQLPNLDPDNTGRAVTPADLKAVLEIVSEAANEKNGRYEVADKAKRQVMRRIANRLQLGEQHEGPFLLGRHWPDEIEKRSRQAPEVKVAEVVGWLDETELHGSDRLIKNLVVATYALAADKAWYYHGAPTSMPPLDRIDGSYTLRSQILPEEAEFETAVRRAGAVFGIPPLPVRNARTVKQLADALRAKARDLDAAAGSLARALEQHVAMLGIDPAASAGRLATARWAHELTGEIIGTEDPTTLVRRVARAEAGSSDQELSKSLSSAAAIVEALNRVDWHNLDAIEKITGTAGAVGRQAAELLATLRRAAAADEIRENLAPVLGRTSQHASALLREAAQSTGPARPIPPQSVGPAVPQPTAVTQTAIGFDEEPKTPTAGDVPLDVDTRGPAGSVAGSTPAGPVRRRVRAAEAEAVLSEIRRAAATRPGARLEVTWELVEDGTAP
jgi:hypothetical protein